MIKSKLAKKCSKAFRIEEVKKKPKNIYRPNWRQTNEEL